MGVKLVITALTTIAVSAIAVLIMFAPNASATLCPYVTAPVAQCEPGDGPTGFGNGPSPLELPVGYPGAP